MFVFYFARYSVTENNKGFVGRRSKGQHGHNIVELIYDQDDEFWLLNDETKDAREKYEYGKVILLKFIRQKNRGFLIFLNK